MKWTNILNEIWNAGLTDEDIADLVKEQGQTVHQSTVNRLRNGSIKTVSYEVGEAIISIRNRLEKQGGVVN